MHPDQIPTSLDLARRLIATQFPQWADLPLEAVESGGTDNAIYRLGTDMAVRLPILERVALQAEKERRWLPHLAPDLPLPIPAPIAHGEPAPLDSGDSPADGFPLPWSITPWFTGAPIDPDQLANPTEVARELAAFVAALHAIDPAGGPAPGKHNFGRGVPLTDRDAITRERIADAERLVEDLPPIEVITAAWDADLNAPAWDGPPRWVHGDLHPGNILTSDDRLTAIIDWGGLGIGDPAVDLLPAWTLFSGDSRHAYRHALQVDDATWARGRGWALSIAILALPYLIDTNPSMVRMSRLILDEVLADHAG